MSEEHVTGIDSLWMNDTWWVERACEEPEARGQCPTRGAVRNRQVRAGEGAGSHTEAETYATTSNFCATSTIALIARSRCSRVCAALIWQRKRAAPCGTTGKPKPET